MLGNFARLKVRLVACGSGEEARTTSATIVFPRLSSIGCQGLAFGGEDLRRAMAIFSHKVGGHGRKGHLAAIGRDGGNKESDSS